MSPRLSSRTGDRGVTAVEYALIVFLVAIAMLIGVVLLQRSLGAAFAASADSAGGSTSTPSQTSSAPNDDDDENGENDGDGDDGSNGNGNGNGNGTPGKPGAPAGVTAVRSADSEVTVSWSAPGSNGGRAVTGYTVEFETETSASTCNASVTGWNDGSASAGASANSTTKTGLTSGWYCVRVSASNGVTSGTTAYAYAGPIYSRATKPGDPTGLTLAWSPAGTINASWTAPSDTGGATVSYDLEWEGVTSSTNCSTNNYNGSSSTSSGVTKSISSLTPTSWYCVAVRATNTAGDSGWIFAGPFKPGPSAPGAPVIGSVTRSSGQLSVAFTAPTDDGGATISNYQYSTNGGSNWTTRSPSSTTSPLVITGLTNGTAYDVVIRAVNSAGGGDTSNSVSGTPATTPGAPTIGTITRGDKQLSVAFTAGSDGGSAITNYQYSTNGGSSWTTRSPSSTTSPLVITGLTNGTSYSVQLRAVNAEGNGAASSSSSATPKAPYSGSTPNSTYPASGFQSLSDNSSYTLNISIAGLSYTSASGLPNNVSFDAASGKFTSTNWNNNNTTVTVNWSIAETATVQGTSGSFSLKIT